MRHKVPNLTTYVSFNRSCSHITHRFWKPKILCLYKYILGFMDKSINYVRLQWDFKILPVYNNINYIQLYNIARFFVCKINWVYYSI